MILCIDFDGTCVKHKYPEVGEDIGAVPVLKRLVAHGHKLILFTMRSGDCENGENPLNDAVNWFKENDIPLFGINTNPDQHKWTASPKAYGQLYIDDAALGCPLIKPYQERPYVDWDSAEALLSAMGLFS